MFKEINYPIKYAVLELKENGGWATGNKCITLGFIVSKCYVLKSKVVYHSNGTSTINHEVVFPFEDISLFKSSLRSNQINIGTENIPNYDACDRPYPVNIVSAIFDAYEQAKAEANEKNDQMKFNKIRRLSVTGPSLNALIREHEENLKICNEFEQLVLKAAENMIISEEPPMDSESPAVRVLKPIKSQFIKR